MKNLLLSTSLLLVSCSMYSMQSPTKKQSTPGTTPRMMRAHAGETPQQTQARYHVAACVKAGYRFDSSYTSNLKNPKETFEVAHFFDKQNKLAINNDTKTFSVIGQ